MAAGASARGCPPEFGDGDIPPRERRRHPSCERAVGRRQRRRAVGRFDRFAQSDGDRKRLLIRVRRFDDGQSREASREPFGKARFSETGSPQIGRHRRAQRFGNERHTIMRGRDPQHRHLAAVEAELLQQPMHGELGVTAFGLVRAVLSPIRRAGDGGPGLGVEMGVEAGQHDGAVREPGDRCDEPRGGGHRAGGAGDDHRAVRLARKAGGFGRDHAVAARGRLDRLALGKNARPVFARDGEEFQGELPVFVEVVGHEPIEPLPRDLAHRHVVDQAGEVVRERQRGGRRADHERRGGGGFRPHPLGKGKHQTPERQAARESRQGGRQIERLRRPRRFIKGKLVLVDIAEGHDPRQDGGFDAEHVEEGIAGEPAGAAGRQVERRRG